MWIQHRFLKRDSIEKPATNPWNNIFDIPNFNETLVGTLGEDIELTTLKMFQNLTWETWELNYKYWRWNWLTKKSYETLIKIKSTFNINICWTDAEKCKKIWEVDNELVDKLIKSKQELSEMMDFADRDLDMIIFYLKLAEKWMLDDFIGTFDKVSKNWCLVANIPALESITFQNIKKRKAYVKSLNENFVFDFDAIYNMYNPFESVECIWENLLKLVEIWHENYEIMNPVNLESIRVKKIWENKYIINANMPSNPVLAWRSFVLVCQYLPEWSKIVEKESLSWDSLSLIAHLFREQKKYNIKVSFQTSDEYKIKLNCDWVNSKLSKLIKEKNIWKNPELFEAKSREDAETVVNEINKLIYKYTLNESIRANVKKLEKRLKKSTWIVELPSFCIEKC